MSGSSERLYDVLFLCTGNSARSLLAEALCVRVGPPRYRGFSAGSQPKAAPHPMTLAAHRGLWKGKVWKGGVSTNRV